MFSPDYSTARERFLAAARTHGWAVESHPIAARGPAGEELFIDVAAHGPGDPSKTLIVSSGVHGVEAPFGSAVQLALLERWTSAPPVRCLFVHSVNPWGFAHRRRTNEDNADLNRNFLLPGDEYRGSPAGYAALNGLLNPPRRPGRFDPFPLWAGWAVLRHGLPKLKQAVAAGQYEYPKGLFYGGSGPGESVRILGEHWERWLGRATDVVHLDFHTGLGRWATHKLLLDVAPTAEQLERLTRWFGVGTFEVCNPHQTAYDARGGFGPWCHARRGDREYLFACAEFGTYGPIRMMGALRAENMAHHWGAAEWAKGRLAEAFCPASAEWRTKVLADAVRLAVAAAEGMSESAHPPQPERPPV
jgi:predicted deacylase